MNRVLLILFLASLMAQLSAQKLEGIYVGEIISPVNVLSIKSKGPEVTGFVYLNKIDKLDFSGSYVDHILRGSIRLAKGGKVWLEGKLGNNPQKLILSPDSSGTSRHRNLYKVSSSSKYEVAVLFSDQNDLMLFGRWEIVKAINNKGDLIDGKFYWEFGDEGSCDVRTIILSSKLAEASKPPGFNPYQVHQQGWATNGGNLTVSNSTSMGTIKHTYRYLIKEDSLFMYQPDGPGLRFFIRK